MAGGIYTVTDLTLAMVAGCLYVADLSYRHDEFTFLTYDRAVEFLLDVLQDTAFILGIKQLPTSPKHAQCDNLVEWFNHTLKAMLSG